MSIRISSLVALAALLLSASASSGEDTPVSASHQRWLEEVAWILTPDEREAFLSLSEEHQREGFIEAFWRARDPDPRTEVNEYRETFYRRRNEAESRFPRPGDDRRRIFVLNGDPGDLFATECQLALWPIEIWSYPYNDRFRRPFALLFYQPAAGGPFRLWHPSDGYAVLQAFPTRDELETVRPEAEDRPVWNSYRAFYDYLQRLCPVTVDALRVIDALEQIRRRDPMLVEVVERPEPPDPEWLATFRAYPTAVPPDAPALAATLEIVFPRIHQTRTELEATVRVTPPEATSAPGLAWQIDGEVLREGALHDSFRYRYEIPAPDTGESRAPVPLVFVRPLRGGPYRLIVKVEEIGTGRAVRFDRDVQVPSPSAVAVRSEATAGLSIDASTASPPPPPGLELLPPDPGLHVGLVRIEARAADPRVARVRFLVDGAAVATRTRRPWTLEIDLGRMPRAATIRAEALDPDGATISADELVLNPEPHRFRVRVVSPREAPLRTSFPVEIDVHPPEGATVDRVEVFLDERRVATLFQPPWTALLPAARPAPSWLRAVAVLADGRSAEDVVVLAGAEHAATLDVDLVELFVTVLGRDGRPISDLRAEDFAVSEDGRRQRLERFERTAAIPLRLGLLVDTSASMEEDLPEVRSAGLAFLDEVLRPGDQATVATFSDVTRIAAPFTADRGRLGVALAGLAAERSTRLWDSTLETLQRFAGAPGKRALLVLSDGADRGSRTAFADVLAYAQHAGVAVYAISFGPSAAQILEGRRRLATLAEATGGRSFVLGSTDELGAAYAQIQRDLRAQYLLAYQSDAPPGERGAFRAVSVDVGRPGAEARAPAGYWP